LVRIRKSGNSVQAYPRRNRVHLVIDDADGRLHTEMLRVAETEKLALELAQAAKAVRLGLLADAEQAGIIA
jgi:hypothetical protein